MSFSEDFAIALGEAGIPIDPASVPEQEVLLLGLQKVREWTESLEEPTRGAVDEVTGDFQMKAALADPEVDIAPELPGLLAAFDAVKASLPISQVLQICDDAAVRAIG